MIKKAIANIFQIMVKKQLTGKILVISSITVSVLGLGSLLFPIVDGWSEIFIPGTPSGLLIEFLLAVMAFVATATHIICLVVTLFHKRSVRYIAYIIPIVMLMCISYLLYPTGVTRTHRRIDSFQLGAQTRVMWAGGPSKIREDAFTLLTTAPEASPPPSEWPDSINALGASYVEINKKERVIQVQIPRRHAFYADQFGYLILDKNAIGSPSMDLLEQYGNRIWKIADGIYLYERW